MEEVMLGAVDYVLEHWEKTGRFVEPTLNKMYAVSNTFYYKVIQDSFKSADIQKKAQEKHEPVKDTNSPSRKRLAKWPLGIPRTLPGLEKIFRDKRYWPKIMKRSQLITDSVRKLYLQKLKIRFNHIIPELHDNRMTPAEAKKELMQAWEASKSRVELIFRTETTTYYGKTQTAFFNGDPQIIGFLFDALRDRATTEWCRSRHGLIYKPGSTGINGLSQNTPACHWNCRSHLIPLTDTPYNRKLLEDPNRDPEKRKVVALPPGWRK
jgi:SPP1 gp7 family putative phage head morphogenesis protein